MSHVILNTCFYLNNYLLCDNTFFYILKIFGVHLLPYILLDGHICIKFAG